MILIKQASEAISYIEFASHVCDGYQEFESDLIPSPHNAHVISDQCYDHPASLVALSDKDVAGIVAISDTGKSPLQYREVIAHGWLYYVLPKYRRTNILNQMLEVSREILKGMGIRKICGEADPSHRASRMIMFRQGFKVNESALKLQIT